MEIHPLQFIRDIQLLAAVKTLKREIFHSILCREIVAVASSKLLVLSIVIIVFAGSPSANNFRFAVSNCIPNYPGTSAVDIDDMPVGLASSKVLHVTSKASVKDIFEFYSSYFLKAGFYEGSKNIGVLPSGKEYCIADWLLDEKYLKAYVEIIEKPDFNLVAILLSDFIFEEKSNDIIDRIIANNEVGEFNDLMEEVGSISDFENLVEDKNKWYLVQLLELLKSSSERREGVEDFCVEKE